MDVSQYHAKVTACWLGKAIGGTLGQPHEGKDGPLTLDFYDPVPTEALPNDDLDLQVVSAVTLGAAGKDEVSKDFLGQAWQKHVTFPFDEFGVGRRNQLYGLAAPMSGQYDNWFAECMGAPIRSELWACLAPGRPEMAASYAYEDACVDHAGEGIWAEVVLATLESLAFVQTDRRQLLDAALGFLPADSRVRRAIEDTCKWWDASADWLAVRHRIYAEHGHRNFTDVAQNLAFTVLGWLAGDGDFGRSICIAVNCGQDTDCTGATLGALMGIIDPTCIPRKWSDPIGDALILSPGIIDLDAPKTINGFTDLVVELAQRTTKSSQATKLPAILPPSQPDPDMSNVRVPVVMWQHPFDVSTGSPPTPLGDASETALPGHWMTDERLRQGLAMRFSVNIDQPRDVKVMASTYGKVRAWLDDEMVVERAEPGNMIPSFHRAIPRCSKPQRLKPGQYALTVSAQVDSPSEPDIVVGIADPESNHWLPWALAQKI